MRKFVAIFLLVSLLMLNGAASHLFANPLSSTLHIGDYVMFGTYNKAPIKWRIIELDADGNPLLFSEAIISVKAFATKTKGTLYSEEEGNNYYPESVLRQWLNSRDSKVNWLQTPPNEQYLADDSNTYDEEPGFLSTANFSSEQLGWIKPYTHRIVISSSNESKAEGGYSDYLVVDSISEYLANYESDAFFQHVTDDVMLLSVKQIKELVYDRGWDVRAKLTPEAKKLYKLDPELIDHYVYWLNTPESQQFTKVVADNPDSFASTPVILGYGGVRPAVQLDISKINTYAGDGSVENPYALQTPQVDIVPPTTPTKLTVGKVDQTSAELSWQPSSDASNLVQYMVYRDGILLSRGASTSSTSVLRPNTQYTFYVKAFDSAGNISGPSNTVSLKTLPATIKVIGNKLYVNDKRIIDKHLVSPILVNGRVMVPLRMLAEPLELKLTWNAKKATMRVTRETYELEFRHLSRQAIANGVQQYTLPHGAYVKNGTLMVPLRFIGDRFEYKVSYFTKEVPK